jgi:hypothetical protein
MDRIHRFSCLLFPQDRVLMAGLLFLQMRMGTRASEMHHHRSNPNSFSPNSLSSATGFCFSRSNGSPGKA